MSVALFLLGIAVFLVGSLWYIMKKEKEYKKDFESEMIERTKNHPYVKVMKEAVKYAETNKEKKRLNQLIKLTNKRRLCDGREFFRNK